jgi:nucleotide-binding universal stress UspA family protein
VTEERPSSPAVRRSILLVVDAAPLPLPVLEAAAALAAEWQAPLAGLFVEDIDLLRAAALPFSCELDFTTAAVRPLESLALARLLRERAEAMRAAIEQQAAASRIEWTFRTSQGELVRETLAAASEAELFIVCRSIRGAPTTGGASSSRLAGGRTAPPVLSVYDGSEESSQVLRVAVRLARLSGAKLIVTVPNSPDAASAEALRQSCRRLLADKEIAAEIHPAPLTDAQQLLQAAHRFKTGWLVIGRDCPLLDEVHLRRLAEGLGHPIVLVRSPTEETGRPEPAT